jgi:luciferase family oxidoreductase group 1
MDFGVFYEIQVASPLKHRQREYEAFHQVLAQVELAEEMGFKSFWTVEHHFQPGFSHCSAPEVLYGAVSQRTKKIRIGHGVVLLPFPYNHPVRVAERIATLDILSHGRVEVGTGRSATVQELGGFGIPPSETRARWEEALDIITTIWKSKDGTFAYKGRYFDIPERTVVPMPIQKPHPPLWVAATSPETHELAGKKGLGLLSLTVLVNPEELGRRVRIYREALKAAQPVGAAVNSRAAAFAMVHCAETDQEARAEAERAFISYTNTTLQFIGPVIEAMRAGKKLADVPQGYEYMIKQYEGIDLSKLDLDFMIDNGMCVVGSPETCIKQIKYLQEAAQLDTFLAMMQYWSIPHEKTMKALRLFGEQVMPYFQNL